MIRDAANWTKRRGQKTVLGGMIPVDPHWLMLLGDYGALDHIDVVAIHGFPGMWWDGGRNWDWHAHWNGWDAKAHSLRAAARGKPIWVTETGLATWELTLAREAKFDLQVRMLCDAADAPVDRVYWYCLFDLDPMRDAIEGFHVDENEYHLGLLTHDGRRKPAWAVMREMMQTSASGTTVPSEARDGSLSRCSGRGLG
jgi:CDP-paratose 2-epimerase